MKDIIIDGWCFKYEVGLCDTGDNVSYITNFYYGTELVSRRHGFLWLQKSDVPEPVYRFHLDYDIENTKHSVSDIVTDISLKNIRGMIEDCGVKEKWLSKRPLVISTRDMYK
tara:strand:+ start:53 stop:388 length:336 start_codon:yes stop_codon:yes gene_type:complete